jgi:hypothetical protein
VFEGFPQGADKRKLVIHPAQRHFRDVLRMHVSIGLWVLACGYAGTWVRAFGYVLLLVCTHVTTECVCVRLSLCKHYHAACSVHN